MQSKKCLPKLIVILALIFGLAQAGFGQCSVFFVTNTNDSGDGSLRQAILDANFCGIGDIYFSIQGTGPHVISPQTTLPIVTAPTIDIDGRAGDSNWYQGKYVVDGGGSINDGLRLGADNIGVFGLEIRNFNFASIWILSGTNTSRIGDTGKGNILSDSAYGIEDAGGGCSIWANTIRDNATYGIFCSGGFSASIGSTFASGRYNNIEDNGTGVFADDVVGVAIWGNRFRCNGVGIELVGTANNQVQPPTVTYAGTDEIRGTASPYHYVQVYIYDSANIICNGADACQGNYFLGAVDSDAAGNWTLPSSSYALSLLATDELTATQSIYEGIEFPTPIHTSEFSECRGIGCFSTDGQTIFVTNTLDSGPGSLRQAIECANADPNLDNIYFNIDGAGPHVFSIASTLPVITDDNVTIDTRENDSSWYSGKYVLDGGNQIGDGFRLEASGINILGFEVRNFVIAGIWVRPGSQSCNIGAEDKGNIVHSNRYGIEDAGGFTDFFANTIRDNTEYGIYFNTTNGGRIGSLNTAGLRNTFSDNLTAIYIEGVDDVSILTNTFICNETVIDLDPTANEGIQPPVISYAGFDAVRGTADPGNLVQVYIYDPTNILCNGPNNCQGNIFLGSTNADAAGNWELLSADYAVTIFTTDEFAATQTNYGGIIALLPRNTSEFSECYLFDCFSENGTTIIVTNTFDSGPGSFRQAIECVNASSVMDTIHFGIDGIGPFEIFLETDLPPVTDDGVVIDASTQPQGQVVVNGTNNVGYGLQFDAPNPELYGIEIYNCNLAAVLIGPDAVFANIGDVGRRNQLHDNLDGIEIQGSDAEIFNNDLINNQLAGVFCNGVTGFTLIGDNSANQNNDNRIIGNDRGVEISGNSNNVAIARNRFFCNVSEGIRIDPGGNNDQAPPTNLAINGGSLVGTANPGDFIQVYRYDPTQTCPNGSTICQGNEHLGDVFADGNGLWQFTLPGNLSPTDELTATATEVATQEFTTSMFSECISVCSQLEVTAFNNSPVCPGEPFQLSSVVEIIGSGNEPITYSWSHAGGYTSDEQNPSDATDPGLYTVIVDNGCDADTATTVVTFFAEPTVFIITSARHNLCWRKRDHDGQWDYR